jgi:hypothetical protein
MNELRRFAIVCPANMRLRSILLLFFIGTVGILRSSAEDDVFSDQDNAPSPIYDRENPVSGLFGVYFSIAYQLIYLI